MAGWKREHDFDALIRAAAAKHGVQPALVKAIVAAESGFNPAAIRQEPKRQDFSAGLMQVLLGTARRLGYTGTSGDPSTLTGLFDPATNLDIGARLLAANIRLTGSTEGAISAYNGGLRPALGFGLPATKPVTVCLARDQRTGACIKSRTVGPGEYANAEYVSKVLVLAHRYAMEGV